MSNILPIDSLHPIFAALIDIQKSRTEFQLKHFVVGQHDTDEQKYKQCLLEIQSIIYNIKISSLELKKSQIETDRLRATGDEIDELDAQIKELGMDQTRLTMIGAQRELVDLVAIWESFPHKFSYEEIESSQPDYWNKRLSRQSILESVGGSQAQAAHLDALRQMGALTVGYDGIKTVNNEVEENKMITEGSN